MIVQIIIDDCTEDNIDDCILIIIDDFIDDGIDDIIDVYLGDADNCLDDCLE